MRRGARRRPRLRTTGSARPTWDRSRARPRASRATSWRSCACSLRAASTLSTTESGRATTTCACAHAPSLPPSLTTPPYTPHTPYTPYTPYTPHNQTHQTKHTKQSTPACRLILTLVLALSDRRPALSHRRPRLRRRQGRRGPPHVLLLHVRDASRHGHGRRAHLRAALHRRQRPHHAQPTPRRQGAPGLLSPYPPPSPTGSTQYSWIQHSLPHTRPHRARFLSSPLALHPSYRPHLLRRTRRATRALNTSTRR